MGKVRRLRKKYHKVLKAKKDEKPVEEETKKLNYEDLVSGNYDKMDIQLDAASNKDLNVIEDDKVSVRSIAKSLKSLKYSSSGKVLKKDEIRKLRHDIFMQKLDFLKKLERPKGTKGKRLKNSEDSTLTLLKSLNDKFPPLLPEALMETPDSNTKISLWNDSKKGDNKPVIQKPKGIEKSRTRQKTLNDDVAVFRKLITEPHYKSNPLETISDIIAKKLSEETDSSVAS